MQQVLVLNNSHTSDWLDDYLVSFFEGMLLLLFAAETAVDSRVVWPVPCFSPVKIVVQVDEECVDRLKYATAAVFQHVDALLLVINVFSKAFSLVVAIEPHAGVNTVRRPSLIRCKMRVFLQVTYTDRNDPFDL